MPNLNNENDRSESSSGGSSQVQTDALQLGPRKKLRATDPLIHHGRHFGRTIHALCNIHALINNGIIRMGERSEEPEEAFTAHKRREHRVFLLLLKSVPGLEERIMNSSEEEVYNIATLLQKGASSERADDTKSLKSVIVDWLLPAGEPVIPPIARNIKVDRGFNHKVTGSLLCPVGIDWNDAEIKQKLRSGEFTVSGDQWPIFLYASCKYDETDPWKGLLRSVLLVKTFKHIFTSPSSVEREAKATRSGNACIHGMTSVTPASLAYAATQARFALLSSSVFSCSDTITDSERFYSSLVDLLQDPDESHEVNVLLTWWNNQVFPNYTANSKPVSKNSALARIKAKRAAIKQSALRDANMNTGGE